MVTFQTNANHFADWREENEVFHTDYIGNEQVLTAENEIYMKQQDGELEKIITDASFRILSATGESGYYHPDTEREC